MENVRVCAVVVSYNRKAHLLNLLNSFCELDYKLAGVYVLDNHSSDGTAQSLAEIGYPNGTEECKTYSILWRGMECFYYRNDENTGGSGGFAKVFELAMQNKWDFLWAMDDDVEPEKNCLSELLQYASTNVRVCVPCRTDNNFQDYAITKYELSNPFLLHPYWMTRKVRSADIRSESIRVVSMPFEGPLIACSLIREIGYPNAEYFLFFDDDDYAMRCGKNTEIRYVVSAILHKKIIPSPIENWTWRQYYMTRNRIYFDRIYGKNVFVKEFRPWLFCAGMAVIGLLRGETNRLRIIRMAYRDAMLGHLGKTVEPGLF